MLAGLPGAVLYETIKQDLSHVTAACACQRKIHHTKLYIRGEWSSWLHSTGWKKNKKKQPSDVIESNCNAGTRGEKALEWWLLLSWTHGDCVPVSAAITSVWRPVRTWRIKIHVKSNVQIYSSIPGHMLRLQRLLFEINRNYTSVLLSEMFVSQ